MDGDTPQNYSQACQGPRERTKPGQRGLLQVRQGTTCSHAGSRERLAGIQIKVGRGSGLGAAAPFRIVAANTNKLKQMCVIVCLYIQHCPKVYYTTA